MNKRILTFCIAVVLLFVPLSAKGAENEEAADFPYIFSKMSSPVLLKYIALENNSKVISDAKSKTASVADKNGVVLMQYGNLIFIGDEPVIDAGILQHDLGWTVNKHIPNTDMFHNEADAIAAGGFTYYNRAETYYIGRCYGGHYFSPSPGEHIKKCSHTLNLDMLYEIPVSFEKAGSDDLLQETTPPQTAPTYAEVFEHSKKPVFLRYILQKNGYSFSYSETDNKITIYDSKGVLLTSIKSVPSLRGEFVMDASAIERVLGLSNNTHEPDTDLFDDEGTAIAAGWFTYYPSSENGNISFYIGNCYGGYYFSPTPGEHLKGCDHSYNSDMFFEKPVTIENGNILDDEAEPKGVLGNDIESYKEEKGKIAVENPARSLTKMVTVMHTEYAKEGGVQTLYFSYRDRAYRNYWEDLSNYDVTDYIFIPPDFPATESFRDFNKAETTKMAEAIGQLLKHRKDARLWIGTPGITSMNYKQEAITPDAITDFLNEARIRIGTDIWAQSVEGVYINQESVYPEEAKKQVDRIKNTVELFKAKNPSKKTLWIPYYDLAENSSDIAVKIAEVSRIPDLFDYIIIQPGYFFFEAADGAPNPETTSHRSQNVDAVMSSAKNNYVSNAVGAPVDGKTSRAAIGLEMEPQASYFSSSRDTRDESLDRYTKYLVAGAEIKDVGPIAFYTSGDPHCNKEALVYKFYGADSLGANVVRKKLDDTLDKFYSYVFETREKDELFYEYTKKLYLSASPQHTEESFKKVYNASIILPEFYLYEKTGRQAHEMTDLSEYINEFGEISDTFNTRILSLLGVGL